MNIHVKIDPINMSDPKPPTLTVMVEPGADVSPEDASAQVTAFLEQLGLAGIPFKMIGGIERHTTGADGVHVHSTVHTHAHQ